MNSPFDSNSVRNNLKYQSLKNAILGTFLQIGYFILGYVDSFYGTSCSDGIKG
jgi:hypothetical protein